MIPKPFVVLAAGLALTACQKKADEAPAAPPAPAPTATVTVVVPVAASETPKASSTLSVTPEPTPCGAEKLQNYLNLLPTSTAKDEIARTLGHNRIRYVGLPQEKAEASPGSTRVTAGLGADGRIKEFSCG